MERNAERVEASAGHVQAAVQRSAEVAAEVEAKVARAENRAGAVEQHADRAIAAVTAAERHVARANEAAADADRNASRAGEQAGSVEETARKLTEAAAAAEREAERAREAAAEAESAAGVARQAADEAEASRHGQREERRVISRYEPQAAGEAPAVQQAGAGGAQENGHAAAPAAAPAPAGADPRRPLFANTRDTAPKREERPGFDDVKQPMASIALDGRFQALNPAFSDLLGYTEAEFQQAVWPPVMDRANLDKHRQQLKDMLEGRAESVEINTGYVHAQGLLVPIVGTLSLVREGGEPDHFLLQTS
jgi:PAS domain S-box-containing protein